MYRCDDRIEKRGAVRTKTTVRTESSSHFCNGFIISSQNWRRRVTYHLNGGQAMDVIITLVQRGLRQVDQMAVMSEQNDLCSS